MQPYKSTQKKINLKACDQCYRCKVKCTMEPNGCARCRATDGVCTYSLGKWMGRPKKSGQQGSRLKLKEAEGARSASLELERDYIDQITDAPNEKPGWELGSFAVDDPMEFFDNTTISPFSIDDYHQPGTEGCYSSTSGSLGRASSIEETRSRATSHVSNFSRETPQSDIETANGALSREHERKDSARHLGGSHLRRHISQALECSSFNFDSMGIDSMPSPQVSSATTIPVQVGEQARRTNSGQDSPQPQEDILLSRGESFRCKCSQVALACLNRISAVPSEARYIECLKVIQLTFLSTESLVFCNDCPPEMIVAKCCIILGNAYELVREAGFQSDDKVGPDSADSRQSREAVRQVKRRATMLFAGLNALQDSACGGGDLSKMQSEFLAMLARSWVSLRED